VRLALAVLLLPASARAQIDLSGLVTVTRADHRVDAGVGVERASGVLVGGATRLRLPHGIAFTVFGETGHLTAVQGTGGIDRDVSQLGAVVEFVPLAWLALESGVTVRSFGTVLARQRWTFVRAGAEARIPLSGETIWAVGRAHLLPVVSVHGLPNAATAFDAGTGLAYRRGRLILDLTYAVERCDFPWQGSTRRSEQFGTLAIRGGILLRLH
jgi:hypothetical protein